MSNNRLEEVKSSFEQRDNCAQAIFSVYGHHLGVDHNTCLKIASVFGGGINRTGNMCGAVTGALMAIGVKYADLETKDPSKSYEAANEFIKKFTDINGTTICRKLINHDLITSEDLDQAYKTGICFNKRKNLLNC
jgi:C_GCAxxG_C_C family probable redox protein